MKLFNAGKNSICLKTFVALATFVAAQGLITASRGRVSVPKDVTLVEHLTRLCRIADHCVEYNDGQSVVSHGNASNRTAPPFTSVRLDLNYDGPLNATMRTGRDNLCIDGHLAPSFFLLGAQKSATTNFAWQLAKVALSIFPAKPPKEEPNYYWKELHIFDNFRVSYPGPERYESIGKQGWLNYYPKCDANSYGVALDATPSYLSSPVAPMRIQAWYGHEQSKRIQFLVMLRNPFTRMHSSWYHSKENGGCSFDRSYCGTFQEYCFRALVNYQSGCPSGKFFETEVELAACEELDNLPMGDAFFLSFYAQQLRLWLAAFDSRQFVVAPFLTYVAPKPGTPSLLEFMANHLGSAIEAGASIKAARKGNTEAGKTTVRPSLENDLVALGPDARAALEEVITAQAGPDALAEVLAPAIENGLVLFGYKGTPSDLVAIANWIDSNW